MLIGGTGAGAMYTTADGWNEKKLTRWFYNFLRDYGLDTGAARQLEAQRALWGAGKDFDIHFEIWEGHDWGASGRVNPYDELVAAIDAGSTRHEVDDLGAPATRALLASQLAITQ